MNAPVAAHIVMTRPSGTPSQALIARLAATVASSATRKPTIRMTSAGAVPGALSDTVESAQPSESAWHVAQSRWRTATVSVMLPILVHRASPLMIGASRAMTILSSSLAMDSRMDGSPRRATVAPFAAALHARGVGRQPGANRPCRAVPILYRSGPRFGYSRRGDKWTAADATDCILNAVEIVWV